MTGTVKNLKFHELRESACIVGFISVYVKFLPCFVARNDAYGTLDIVYEGI